MSDPVVLPLWLFSTILALAALFALDRLLLPGLRWYMERRSERVVDELNSQLSIRLQPFKLTRRRVLIDRLVHDEKVLEAATRHARSCGITNEQALRDVTTYAKEIVPSFNAYMYFRIGCWLARTMTRLTYRVRKDYTDEEAIGNIDPDATVVFVINHRSNMDYVLVSYLASFKTALSYAVGEWARFPGLAQLLRSMGAFFVRRGSRDPIYRKVLERYVQMATKSGVTQAVFPEGGLSRDGRLREPRMGILSYMLRGFEPGAGRDIVFVPVGINYDRTLEDRTLVESLDLDAPRRGRLASMRRTLGLTMRNLWLIAAHEWHSFGYACVHFGRPLSLERHLAECDLGMGEPGSEAHSRAVSGLAGDLMDELGRLVPAVPVSLMATVFIRQAGEEIDEFDLQYQVHLLIDELEESGAHVYVPRRDRSWVIHVGLHMLSLRGLVLEEEGLYTAAPEELGLLEYYANSIAHLLDRGPQVATHAPESLPQASRR